MRPKLRWCYFRSRSIILYVIESALILALGLVALYFGGKWLVGGASQLAASLGVRPFVIGLTIIGFGSSAPELALSILANAESASAISLGNVVGANITNMTYVLGISAIIAPLAIKFSLVRREGLVALASLALLMLLVLGGSLGFWGGALMLGVFIIYLLVFLGTLKKCDPENDVTCQFEDLGEDRWGKKRSIGILLLGLGVLVLGAQAVVTGAMDIASGLGVSEVLIGVTIVSIGTTLPELTIAIFSGLKKTPDVAIGNALGTIIFNTLVVLGMGALVSGGIEVPSEVLFLGIIPMIGLTLLPIATLQIRGGIGRRMGVLMVALYIIYLAVLIFFS
jgi:cation:H+ antiporter